MGKGGCGVERVRRGIRTAFFVAAMAASLVAMAAPVLVGVGDVAAAAGLAWRFACGRCYGWRGHVERYRFRSSLMDLPLLSVGRSILIVFVYALCNCGGVSHEAYLGTAALCSIVSLLILSVKACLFTPSYEIDPGASALLARQIHHSNNSWAMPVLFLSSLVFALGHVIIAYKTSWRARRKMLLHCLDPESAIYCKNAFSGYHKVPRSPTPCIGKSSKSDTETERKARTHKEHGLPISLLADIDSMFIVCQGLTLHYKLCSSGAQFTDSLLSAPFLLPNPSCSKPNVSPGRYKPEKPSAPIRTQYHHNRSFSNQFRNSSLHEPLLTEAAASPIAFANEIPALNLDDDVNNDSLSISVKVDSGIEEREKFAVVLVHGFGGGVFSWRHLMGVLAQEIGCTVVAFDRPGWGLTSRVSRKDWEEKKLPNPYRLETQVDLLISFCLNMGFSSVILVGHDDGGLLALKAAAKIRASAAVAQIEVKGVVLLGVSLSREVIPPFARILLHTSLGKKHLVRPLLRTEITQVINRHTWYDTTKLTAEVLKLYKAPLFVEGWDDALHEIGRLSFATVLSPADAMALLKSVEDLPVMVVAGAEDALVSLKSAQSMASKLVNSRLVAISGCGHLPHEECPKALLAALSPFITRLLSSQYTLQRH